MSFNLALANGSALGGGTDYGTGGAGNLEVSTDGGTTWTDAASATIAAREHERAGAHADRERRAG